MRFSYCNCFIDDVNVIPNSYIIWNNKCGILIGNIINEIKYEYFKCKPPKPIVLPITHPPLSCCNLEKKARSRSRYANTNLNKKYYSTNNRYLYSRCKLYNQNNFNFLSIGDNTVKPGDPHSLHNEYTGSYNPDTIITSTDIINAYKCSSSVQYKPNNYKYSKQGSVSSGGHLLNLIVSTINKNTNDIKLNPQLKSKYFPSSGSSQKTICCPTAKPDNLVVFVYIVNKLYTVNELNIARYIPILTNSNFKYTYTYQYSSGTITLKITYNDYTYGVNGSTTGLSFKNINIDDFNNKFKAFIISSFSGIPLNTQGGQFAGITSMLIFTTTDVPVILPNNNVSYCFYGCTNFNSNLSNWNSVNFIDTSHMFDGAVKFNNGQTQNSIGNLPLNWSLNNITNMAFMFYGASNFNQTVDFNTSAVTNMNSMFQNCSLFNNGDTSNVASNPLSFTTTAVTDMSFMFYGASNFNQKINTTIFTTSAVTNMNSMFQNCSLFNNGDTSNVASNPLSFTTTAVTDMTSMFYGASNFNQTFCNNITSTNLQYVTTMVNMFTGATIFNNGGLSNDITHPLWPFVTSKPNTSLNFSEFSTSSGLTRGNTPGWMYPYYGISKFIYAWKTMAQVQPITSIYIPVATNTDFVYGYTSTTVALNTTVTVYYKGTSSTDLAGNIYNTAGLTCKSTVLSGLISFIINNCSSLTYDQFGGIILHPGGSQFTSINCVFTNAINDTQPVIMPNTSLDNCFGGFNVNGLSNSEVKFNTTNVTSMIGMFANNLYFTNKDMPINFVTINVTNMVSFMYNCKSFNQPINLTTPLVTNMEAMFTGCDILNSTITLSNTSKVQTFSRLLQYAPRFNKKFTLDNTSSASYMSNMFNGCVDFNNGSANNDGQNSLSFSTSTVQNIASMFNGAVKFNQTVKFDTSAAVNMNNMFYNCGAFNNGATYNSGLIPLEFTTTVVTDMAYMFYSCVAFNQTVNFNTSAVIDMNNMFNNCTLFNNGDTSNVASKSLAFNTSNVKNMTNMFKSASKFNQKIYTTNFTTSNVRSMNQMFQNCALFNNGDTPNVASNPLSFTTTAVTDMANMFFMCTAFNQQITFTNTSAVNTMANMFQNCSLFNNGDTNNARDKQLSFKTTNVISMENMFLSCIAFNQQINYNPDNITTYLHKVSNMNSMFKLATVFNNGQVSNDTAHVLFSDYYSNKPPALPANPTSFCQSSALLSGNAPSWGKS